MPSRSVTRLTSLIFESYIIVLVTQSPLTEADCSDLCVFPDLIIGDQICDDESNTCACSWDGGDCCSSSADKTYCNHCVCLHTTTASRNTTTTTTTTTLSAPEVCVDGKSMLGPDNIVNWTDAWGHDCDAYAFNHWCKLYGPVNADLMGRTASIACCACGGGNVNNEWIYTTEAPCTGSLDGWELSVTAEFATYFSLGAGTTVAPSTLSTSSIINKTSVLSPSQIQNANITLICDLFDHHRCNWQPIVDLQGTLGLTVGDACCQCGANYTPTVTLPPELCFGGLGTWALEGIVDENGQPFLTVKECNAAHGASIAIIIILILLILICVGTKIIQRQRELAKIAVVNLPAVSKLETERERLKKEEAECHEKKVRENAKKKALEAEFQAKLKANRSNFEEESNAKLLARQAQRNEKERVRRLQLKLDDLKRREAEFRQQNPDWEAEGRSEK